MSQTQSQPHKPPAAAGFSRFHAWLLKVSGGKVGGKIAGQKIVVLNVVGRRSGKVFPTPVVGVEYDGELYVVASHNGAHENPTWFVNLRDRPDFTVTVDGDERRVRAEVLAEPERSRIWQGLAERLPLYAKVQAKTERVIPVIRLASARLNA